MSINTHNKNTFAISFPEKRQPRRSQISFEELQSRRSSSTSTAKHSSEGNIVFGYKVFQSVHYAVELLPNLRKHAPPSKKTSFHYRFPIADTSHTRFLPELKKF